LLAVVACGGGAVPSSVRLQGPLAQLAEPVPSRLDTCARQSTQYVAPFWRAPYLGCQDSTPAGGSQYLELDADSVVVAAFHQWSVPEADRSARWEVAATHLTRLFGKPVRGAGRLGEYRSGSEPQSLRAYCALWRGSDSVEVALYLQPTTDVAPSPPGRPWVLKRYARHGPLLGAVSCGARL